MVYYLDRYRIICIALLFIIAAAAVISVYNASGVGWDFLSRYLNGRTIATSYLYHPTAFSYKVPATVNILGANLEFNVTPALSITKGFYFDQVWEPLPSLIMAGFIVLAKGFAIGAYLIFLLVLLLAASLMAAKSFDLDPLLVYALLMSPFVVGTTVLYNGGEILGLSLSLIAAALAVGKSYKSGIFVALSGLVKYDSLIIAPLLFLLGDRKTSIKAITVAAIITLPWLLFNFISFGNPIQSYVVILSETQPQGIDAVGLISMLWRILWYPLVLFAGSAIIIASLNPKLLRAEDVKALALKNRNLLMIIAFMILGLIGFLLVYNKAQGGIRLGYLAYGGMALLAAFVLSSKPASSIKLRLGRVEVQSGQIIPYMVFIFSVILLLNLYAAWYHMNFNIYIGSPGFRNPVFLDAVGALNAQNLSGCSIVSNAWPYMNYYNVTAYSPHQCNSTMKRMPVVIFFNQGIQTYCGNSISNLSGVASTYKNSNFSVLLPSNYICMR